MANLQIVKQGLQKKHGNSLSRISKVFRGEKNLFKKRLIANRGEIALRIMRSLKKWNKDVLPYPTQTHQVFRSFAEETYPLNANEARETYLNIMRS
jgi:pyruvate carboxylase